MTKILALDLATCTGFALGGRSGVIVSGYRRFPSTGDDIGLFGRAFRDWLVTGLKRHQPDLIVFEQPMLPNQTNITTLRKLYGLAFELETVAGDAKLLGLARGIECKEVSNGDWIKHFLGAGNVPKGSEARKKAVFRMCGIRGWSPENYDEGDALGVLDYAIASSDELFALQATPLFAEVPVLTVKQQRTAALKKAAGLA
jgi:hypothetical protein